MQPLDVKYNKTSRLQTNVNNLARTLKAKVQLVDLQNPQAGKSGSFTVVVDRFVKTGKHRELSSDELPYISQNLKDNPYFKKK